MIQFYLYFSYEKKTTKVVVASSIGKSNQTNIFLDGTVDLKLDLEWKWVKNRNKFKIIKILIFYALYRWNFSLLSQIRRKKSEKRLKIVIKIISIGEVSNEVIRHVTCSDIAYRTLSHALMNSYNNDNRTRKRPRLLNLIMITTWHSTRSRCPSQSHSNINLIK